MSSQPSKILPAPRIRLAKYTDKDAWVNTMISGYEVDPQYQWRHPRRKEYPEDTRKSTSELFEAVMASDNCICFVAELPRIGEEDLDTAEWVVISIATWEWKDWEEVENETGED
jgi:hypothetical protein